MAGSPTASAARAPGVAEELPVLLRDAPACDSHGRVCCLDTPEYISYGDTLTKYNEGVFDSTAHG